jgi:hypothetical protein
VRALLTILGVLLLNSAQAEQPDYPYLLRLDHYVSGEQTCALLQKTGAFHLEVDNGRKVRVYEGSLSPSQLAEVQSALNRHPLAGLSQQQIEEPLLRTRYDKLQLNIFRGDRWQDLFFRSSDTQETFKVSLQPLLRWLDGLHSLPHKELSEEQGKNNCLPAGKIELKKRGETAREIRPRIASDTGGAPLASRRLVTAPVQVRPLLEIYSLERKTASARERCVLIMEDGNYRIEERAQKASKPVDLNVLGGTAGAKELRELRGILDSPELAAIKHHEPPGGSVVPMLGDKMEIWIARADHDQRIILSSSFGRPGMPAFYGGDASLHTAERLLRFLSERLENGTGKNLSKEGRNGCTQAP